MNNSYTIKTLVPVPAWVESYGQTQTNKVTDATDAYAKVPLVFRATRIRCNALSGMPWHLYRGASDTEVEWPFETPLTRLLWKSEAATLLAGAHYLLKAQNSVRVRDLQWLNPTTMEVKLAADGKSKQFQQHIGSDTYPAPGEWWSEEDIIYVPEFSLSDDIGPGDCAASVALGDARLAHYLTRYAATFFENGAMPVTTLSIVGLNNADEKKRIESFYRKALTGIQNAFRVLALGADAKMMTTQSPLKELATPELKEQARKDVALAFEIPVTLLDDDANYATAQEHKRGFYDETVGPRARQIADEWNAQCLTELGYRLEPAPEEMDIYQEDENSRATAFSAYVSGGMDKRVAVAVLGIEIPPDVLDIWEAQNQASDVAREKLNAAPLPGSNGNEQKPPMLPPSGQSEAKALERGQFKRYWKKHGTAEGFQFEHLSADEQKDLLAGALGSDTPNPFQEYRNRLASLRAKAHKSSSRGLEAH